MNLISDLESDLATAFIIEKKHVQKLALRDAVILIDRVTAELQSSSYDKNINKAGEQENTGQSAASH